MLSDVPPGIGTSSFPACLTSLFPWSCHIEIAPSNTVLTYKLSIGLSFLGSPGQDRGGCLLSFPLDSSFFFLMPWEQVLTGTVTLYMALYSANTDSFFPWASCRDAWVDPLKTTPLTQAVPLFRLLIANFPLRSPITQLTASYCWTPPPAGHTFSGVNQAQAYNFLQLQRIHKYIHTNTHLYYICMYIMNHSYICVIIYIIYIYMHTYTHTHIHT